MSNAPKTPQPTKKHLARLQREQMYRRYLIIAAIVVLVITAGLIIYGLAQQFAIEPNQAVADVSGEKIPLRDWQAQVRFGRSNLIRNALQTYSFAQAFPDPSFQASFAQQLQQAVFQLEPTTAGQTVLDQMIENAVIRMEAEKLGISISDDEIEKEFQAAFGFFPEGTPTTEPTREVLPTSTLSSLQLTLIPPTATSTATPTADLTSTPTDSPTATIPVTPSPTIEATPEPTATPYTQEGYEDLYKRTINDYRLNYQVTEKDLRYVILNQIFREKVENQILADLPRSEEQAWARHILVEDEATAKDLASRLEKGESFCDLAEEYSTDDSNKNQCGDLGWFGKGRMVEEFETAAFALALGDVSDPVQTQFGWHIIQLMGKEERQLSEDEYRSLRQTRFQEWLTEVKQAYTITIFDEIWQANVPQEPVLPSEIEAFIQQVLQQQTIPEELIPTTAP
jgi:parvulin-like peptidyl-prolyl isomerase